MVYVLAIAVLGACSGAVGETQLEFAGTECVAEALASIEAGNHTVVLTNTSDIRSLPVYLVELSEGKTYREFAALQETPGDYFLLPDWAEYALRDFSVSDSIDEEQRRFGFVLEPGEHAVYLWASQPPAIWLCGELTVTDG